MSEESHNFQLIFPESFDERSRQEMPDRGYLSHVLVELHDDSRYQVEFIDPVRLSQEVNDYRELDIPCYAEPGLIVLSEVTLERVEEAVQYLHRQGFFKDLKPVNR